MTPLHLEILMHYYTRGVDYEHLTNETVREYLRHHLQDGIMEQETDGTMVRAYRVTEKGRVWIEHILNLPYPQHAWVMSAASGSQVVTVTTA